MVHQMKSQGHFNQLHQSDNLYEPNSGHDSGTRAGGMTYLSTGVPHKQRHRQYLGMENRPGTIRL